MVREREIAGAAPLIEHEPAEVASQWRAQTVGDGNPIRRPMLRPPSHSRPEAARTARKPLPRA